MNKKGFTLIELLTVIAILGILVLLAAPKFLGYTEKANIAHIKSDVKTYETQLTVEELENKDLSKDWIVVASEDVDKYISEKSLYDEYGLVTDPEKVEGEVKLLDKKDIDVKTNLKGEFLYANGEVYYHASPSNSNAGGTTEEPEEPTQPEAPVVTNFEWIENKYDGYTVASQQNRGYYKYTGTEETVVIPESINGDKLTSYYRMFDSTEGIVKKVVSTNKNITSTQQMFRKSTMEELDLSEFDTSNVTDMRGMFYDSKITGFGKHLDLSSFDLSKVTDMSEMFFEFSNLQNADIILPSTSTPALKDTQYMFTFAKIKSLDLSNFNFEKIATFDSMFAGSKIKSLEFGDGDENGKIKFSSATNMNRMFRSAQIPNIDVSNWDVSTVTDMTSMFSGVTTDKIDLSNWNTPNVTKMNAYYSKYNLKGSLVSNSGFFDGSKVGKIIIGPNFNTSKLTSLSRMFANVNMNNVEGLGNIKDTNATQAIRMFASASGTTLDISHLKFNSSIAQNYSTKEGEYGTEIEDGLGGIFLNSKFSSIYVSNQSIIDRVNNEITLRNQHTKDEDRPVMKIK